MFITISLESDIPEFKFWLGPPPTVCPQAVTSPFEPQLPHLENGMKSALHSRKMRVCNHSGAWHRIRTP